MCLSVESGTRLVVGFKYERLPDFCYVCGRLSHHESDCEMATSMKKTTGSVSHDYGPWLNVEFKAGYSNISMGHGTVEKSTLRELMIRTGSNPVHDFGALQGRKDKVKEVILPSQVNAEVVIDNYTTMDKGLITATANYVTLSCNKFSISIKDATSGKGSNSGYLSVKNSNKAFKCKRGRPSKFSRIPSYVKSKKSCFMTDPFRAIEENNVEMISTEISGAADLCRQP
ncbi:hypothetical protein REPUB_Repub16aG0065500 [Reevesia pubescens]